MRSAVRSVVVLLLTLTIGCSSSRNEYGLRVVDSLAEYVTSVRNNPEKQLVPITAAAFDIRYATANNFMKRQLYPRPAAYLRVRAAVALADAQRELSQRGLGLKIFDAYRPYDVTVAMWKAIGNPDYVADPRKGSRHNRGCAIDLTLVESGTLSELPMPTAYDDFTPAAAHGFAGASPEAIANRELLRDVMMRHGFEPLPSEWWHYDFRGWERYELLDLSFAEIDESFDQIAP